MNTKALLLGALCGASIHAQILIDNFSDGDFSISGQTPFASHTGSMLGGERRVAIWPGSGVSASVSSGVLTVDKPGTTSVVLLRYGDFTGNYGSGQQRGTPLHLDVTGNIGFSGTASSISSPLDIHFDLEDGNGLHTTASMHFDAAGTRGAIFGGGANLTDIAGIEIMIPQSSANTGTFAIDSLSFTPTPVPEPQQVALAFGIGLIGFAVIRSCNNKKSGRISRIPVGIASR